MKYTLTLTEEQAAVVQSALDFYYRIGMGQLDEIRLVAVPAHGFKPDPYEVDNAIDVLKVVLLGWKHVGTNHSILSRELPDEMRAAADIHDVIRHRLAMDGLKPGEKPNPAFVYFYEPVRRGKEPLAKISKNKEG